MGALCHYQSLNEADLPAEWFAFKLAHPTIAAMTINSANCYVTPYGEQFTFVEPVGRKPIETCIFWDPDYACGVVAPHLRKGASGKETN